MPPIPVLSLSRERVEAEALLRWTFTAETRFRGEVQLTLSLTQNSDLQLDGKVCVSVAEQLI